MDFSRKCRLTKTDEYSSVFAFRRTRQGDYFKLHFRPNELGRARIGIVVAKKFVRRASQRNLIKRIIRERFRRMQTQLPAMDLVVRLHGQITDATRKALNQDIICLFETLIRR